MEKYFLVKRNDKINQLRFVEWSTANWRKERETRTFSVLWHSANTRNPPIFWDEITPNSSRLSTNKELRNSINAMSFSFVLFLCGERKYFTKMRENVFNQSKQEWSTASLAWRHKLVRWFRVIFFHSLFRARDRVWSNFYRKNSSRFSSCFKFSTSHLIEFPFKRGISHFFSSSKRRKTFSYHEATLKGAYNMTRSTRDLKRN